ncbi:MAG: NUDIX domain-containing protein [Ignavibacteriaceae bacterium]
MTKYQLFKKLLPGLFPLLVFILVDEFYGTAAGLVVAVCFGIAQLLFTYIKAKTFDKFTLFDTLLIVILGSVSYFLDNAVFFKLKPALIGVILCLLLGVSAFSKLNILALSTKKYFEGISLSEEQLKQFNAGLKTLFFIFLFHTILVAYSAFFMSKEAWSFISTVLFYLLFGAYFIYELLKKKIRYFSHRNEEWLPLVDEKGNITGKAPRSVIHRNPDMLHPVVQLMVVNKRKHLYLQKRSMNRPSQPGKWDASVTGHVSVDENVETALIRESEEEIGLTNFNAVAVCKYILRSDNESQLVFLFYLKYDGELKPNPEEVDEGRFWKISEINAQLGTGIFTPGFETDFAILKKALLI